MRTLIHNNVDNCTGCNRCIRVCPVEEANITYEKDKRIIVEADSKHCITCGACLEACHHNSRGYSDDTEQFFADLLDGVEISVIAAPAIRTNFDDWERMLSWLRQLGIHKIYDVSLGADICTWAHITHIQKSSPAPIISQPCPAIVNYILMHRNNLLKHLSPIHSPMLCTAVYMKKYEHVHTKIAALSPCIAKTNEFDDTTLVEYNVTFKKLSEYIEQNNIIFPEKRGSFDHYEAGLGSLYPMPGGLKECVEHYLGKSIRIDKSEGPQLVYEALDIYGDKHSSALPAVFDVLNCTEGCNVGTGCRHTGTDIFDISSTMDQYRRANMSAEMKKMHLTELFEMFNKTLNFRDFVRSYVPRPVQHMKISSDKIEYAFGLLGKSDDAARNFDCGACGCDTCHDMATRIAKGINTPKNCMEKAHKDVLKDHEEARANMALFRTVLNDTVNIKELTESIVSKAEDINDVILSYNSMIEDIEKIAMSVGIIALNASIEAARIGQHGKAFAVVADEIKKLAQSSDASAKRTKVASLRAQTAINAINSLVSEISINVNDSYDHISTVVDSSNRLLENSH
ncbi:MAG: methyl-accepting chemotaxis protein [Oscillospiraceae bacterium]|nr:methyl-accepting chemotaxis protein [Oscillospiraceae bacterium]MCL2278799.1 methyl-accepting chemotaxis protein [Oscillospiraceae bacterium]